MSILLIFQLLIVGIVLFITATTIAAANTTLTGLLATGSVGNVIIQLDRVAITGVTGTSQLGQIIYNNFATVSGVFATGYVGTVYLWSQIDDNQTANWVNIDDSQTPNWNRIAA